MLLLGLVAAAGSLATTVLTTRAPGMNMRRVPLFAWSALVGSLGLLLVLPVVARRAGLHLRRLPLRPRRRSAATWAINDWIGFGFTQPATFVYAVPAFGFAAEVIAVASGRKLPMRGVIFTGIGLVGISAALGAMLQQPAQCLATSASLDSADWLGEVLPYGLFNLLPVLGGFIVISIGALACAAAAARGLSHRWCSACSAP